MTQSLFLVTLVVDDYDRAKAFYCEALGFECLQDEVQPEGKRWVVVKPRGGDGAAFLLAQAANEAQRAAIGKQTGVSASFSRPTISRATMPPCLPPACVFLRSPGAKFTAPLRSLRILTATPSISFNMRHPRPLDCGRAPVHKRPR